MSLTLRLQNRYTIYYSNRACNIHPLVFQQSILFNKVHAGITKAESVERNSIWWQRCACWLFVVCFIYLTILSSDCIFASGSCQLKSKPVVETKWIQILTIQHPLPAFRDAKEPFLVIYVYCKLIDLVPQFYKQHPKVLQGSDSYQNGVWISGINKKLMF